MARMLQNLVVWSILFVPLITYNLHSHSTTTKSPRTLWTGDDQPYVIYFKVLATRQELPQVQIRACLTTRKVTEDNIPINGFWAPCSEEMKALPKMEIIQMMNTQVKSGLDPMQIAVSSQLITITSTDIVHIVRNFVRYGKDKHQRCTNITIPKNSDVIGSNWAYFENELDKQPWEMNPEDPHHLRMVLGHQGFRQMLLESRAKEVDMISSFSNITSAGAHCGKDSKGGWEVSEIEKRVSIKNAPIDVLLTARNLFEIARTEMKGCEFIWKKTKRDRNPVSAKIIEELRENLRDKLELVDVLRLSGCVRNIKELNQERFEKHVERMREQYKCTKCRKSRSSFWNENDQHHCERYRDEL